jgi:rhomboid protease GluP
MKNEDKKSIITIALISVNVIMYIITAILSGDIIDSDIRALIFLGAKVNELISSGEYYRLITAMFLHGGMMHLLLNMYALNALGPFVEKVYGSTKYVIIYFVAGIVSSIFSYMFSEGVSIGASGAIFGLFGAVFIFSLKMKDRVGKGMLKNIISVIGINIFIGISIPNIDNLAHLGGLIGGILISLMFKNKIE